MQDFLQSQVLRHFISEEHVCTIGTERVKCCRVSVWIALYGPAIIHTTLSCMQPSSLSKVSDGLN